jgi:uncharacterized protein (DUF885 family)
MYRISIIAAALLFLFTACTPKQHGNTHQSPDLVFSSWKETLFMDSLWQAFPEWASNQGYHAYDSMLSIPNAAGRRAGMAFWDRIATRLKDFPIDSLSDANKIDLRLIEGSIASSHFYNDEFKEYQWNPANYNIGDAIDYVIENNPAPLNQKLLHLDKRLAHVPDYYAAAKGNITQPTREHTALAIAQSAGLMFFFDKMIPDSIKVSTISEQDKKTLTAHVAEAKQAVNGYIAWLQDMQKAFTAENTRDFRIGKELYAKKFAADIQSRYTAAEMYQKALDRRAYLIADMYALTTTLWADQMHTAKMPTDTMTAIRAMIEHLSVNHCKRDSFLQTVEAEIPTIVNFINEHKLITLDPTKPLKVRKTPDYMAGTAGASINSPGPYDKNGNTYYNVTPLTQYTPADAESYLREYNTYVLSILDIHEALPGHYVQLLYANKSPSLIKSVFGNGAMIEGWACYVERMMVEAGYRQSPEMQLFYDKWNLREVSNLLLDYNLQANGWTEAQVTDLLIRDAFQQKAEAKEKYKRASLSQVQLASYFAGQTEIFELRDEMKAKLGSKFDQRAFHEQFLSYGSAPVKAIRELMVK